MLVDNDRVLTDFVAHPKHGPLPGLLLLLTLTAGIADAVSLLGLGRVFVGNMTGNVAFVGFALAGAPGFSLQASIIALAAFLLGAASGGFLAGRSAARPGGLHRGVLLRDTAAIEVVLLAAAALVISLSDRPAASNGRDVAIGLAAAAMGLQSAVVQALGVPDIRTTVLTTTLTSLAADLRKRDRPAAARQLTSVVALLLGALIGALLVLHVSVAAAMWTAVGVVLVTCVFAAACCRHVSRWQTR